MWAVRAALLSLTGLAGCQCSFIPPQPTGGAGGTGAAGGAAGAAGAAGSAGAGGAGGAAGSGGSCGSATGDGGAVDPGSVGGLGGSFDPAVEASAVAWGEALCSRLFGCMPFAALSRFFGEDAADCAARRARFKARSLSAPGASSDLSYLDACTAALETRSCSDVLDSFMGNNGLNLPECSVDPPGAVPEFGPCSYSKQCETTYCHAAPGVCGKCRKLREEGESCGALPCDAALGLICGPEGTCIKGRYGCESCSATEPCYPNFQCDAGICVPFLSEGEACNPQAPNVGPGVCSFGVLGLICNNQSLVCEPFEPSAQDGDDCGLGVPGGGALVCAPGLLCDMDAPTTPNPYSGTCVNAKAGLLGGPCAFQFPGIDGPPCADDDLRCVGGVCVRDDPATCP